MGHLARTGRLRIEGGLSGYTRKMTWKAPERPVHGDLTTRSNLPDHIFAFEDRRKEPLTDADHVINALARFDQVQDVTDKERDAAWKNILKAAKHFDVDVDESDWRELGKRPHTKNPAHG